MVTLISDFELYDRLLGLTTSRWKSLEEKPVKSEQDTMVENPVATRQCISVLTRIFRLKGTNNICDPAPHLECSDSQYQTLVACVPLSTKDSKSSSMFTEFCSQSPGSS